MPAPFPGMDPYLERGDLWPELHNPLMTYARDALQPVLPPNYVARLELRVFVEREPGARPAPARVPDLELLRTGPGPALPEGGKTATAGPPAPQGFWVEAVPVERREAYAVIRTFPGGELVTVVELLSPSNKRAGEGREKYLRKQAEVLDAGLNLVEIDLLRGGLHTLAAERERLDGLPPYDYLVCIHRSARPWGFWVNPWSIRDPLPPVPVPLRPGEPEILLDLQPLFERAYENAAFLKLVDYGAEPEPPLRPEETAWADALLRAAGPRGDARG